MQDTMVRELLECGADPNLAGSVAVVSAVRGDTAGMLTLIEHGANIHVQEGVPGKALHMAALSMDIDMIKLLLDKGVNVNAFGGTYGYGLSGARWREKEPDSSLT
jgi:ankyrin repeat protein